MTLSITVYKKITLFFFCGVLLFILSSCTGFTIINNEDLDIDWKNLNKEIIKLENSSEWKWVNVKVDTNFTYHEPFELLNKFGNPLFSIKVSLTPRTLVEFNMIYSLLKMNKNNETTEVFYYKWERYSPNDFRHYRDRVAFFVNIEKKWRCLAVIEFNRVIY